MCQKGAHSGAQSGLLSLTHTETSGKSFIVIEIRMDTGGLCKCDQWFLSLTSGPQFPHLKNNLLLIRVLSKVSVNFKTHCM